jgi:hypothetical protein
LKQGFSNKINRVLFLKETGEERREKREKEKNFPTTTEPSSAQRHVSTPKWPCGDWRDCSMITNLAIAKCWVPFLIIQLI